MLKKSAVAAALFFTTVSSNLYALGLGSIDMQSGLNQPMNAVIDLTSASGTDLSEIKITIASKEAHDRSGLTRHRLLSDFKFSVEQDDRGNAFVRVTSTDTVHEPYLEFMLELKWPNGHLLREYTVLVDPPVTMPATPVAPVAPVSRAPVAQAPVRQARPATSRTTAAPVRSAPASASTADSYGPVRRNETLWDIASRTRPGSDITVDQMMHALLRENPRAFVDNNINRLKAGVTLKIPDRTTITAISAGEAIAESRRQAQEWQSGQPAPAEEAPAVASTRSDDDRPEVVTDARLQLTAPEEEAVTGAATASAGDPQAAAGQTETDIGKQLTLATEEAEASKAEAQELQSRVSDLEKQIETMKRLLELKDNALAGMQDRVASDDTAEMPELVELEMPQETEIIETGEQAAAEVEEVGEVIVPEVETAQLAGTDTADEPRGIVNKLMDNPVLAGLGVLVAMLLGGFLWASTRQKSHQSIFDDEMTLEKHMASSSAIKPEPQVSVVDFEVEDLPDEETTSIQGHDESDPITEADVYLAYGRIQQAQDVLQSALEKTPSDNNLRVKLLEVYHAGGNISAFDREASDFRQTVTEDDPQWLRVASMGFALSPGNELYRTAAANSEAAADLDFDMDLSGMDDAGGSDAVDATGQELPESIEFNLDDEVDEIIDDEDANEGLLNNEDEIATKLDLARAYLDMGDPEGARSILDEVMGEGNDDQKREAKEIISQLG